MFFNKGNSEANWEDLPERVRFALLNGFENHMPVLTSQQFCMTIYGLGQMAMSYHSITNHLNQAIQKKMQDILSPSLISSIKEDILGRDASMSIHSLGLLGLEYEDASITDSFRHDILYVARTVIKNAKIIDDDRQRIQQVSSI
jgi:hypothetical protein